MYVFILLLKQGLKTYSTAGTVTVVGPFTQVLYLSRILRCIVSVCSFSERNVVLLFLHCRLTLCIMQPLQKSSRCQVICVV